MSITHEHYYQIKREYDQKQFQVNYERNERIEEVTQKIPRILEIKDRIAELQIHKAKNILTNNAFELEYINSEISSLITERDNLLEANGYAVDYLEAHYFCSDCKDTGYDDEHEMCHCYKQSLIDVLYSQSNVKLLLDRNNFDQFKTEYYDDEFIDPTTKKTARQNITETMDYCRNVYIKEFDTSFRNLLLYGETGVGKTFLTNCIAKELLETSHSVLYLSAIDFSNILTEMTFNSKNISDQDRSMFAHIYDCDLLIIDDLGTEVTNSLKSSNLFNCLEKRLSNKKSTIISTNLSPMAINKTYSDRIFSRIIGNYTCFKLFGDDIRRKQAL